MRVWWWSAVAMLALSAGCSSVYTYSGTVVDGNGKAIELVRVELMRKRPSPLASPKRLGGTTADESGRFTIDMPRRCTYLVIGGWEVDASEALGDQYPLINLPATTDE